MSKMRRGLSFLLCLAMIFTLFAGVVIPGADVSGDALAETSNTNPGGTSEWITAWHTSMLYLNGDSTSNLSTAVGTLSALRQRTFRTLIQMPMAGNTVRLTYSNEYSTSAVLKIGEISIALGKHADPDAWASAAYVAVKDEAGLRAAFASAIASGDAYMGADYYGNAVVCIKPGKTVTTEAINIASLGLTAMGYLSVSTFVCDMTAFGDGITGGLIGGKTVYMGIGGVGSAVTFNFNHTEIRDLNSVGVVPPIELWNSDDTGEYNIVPFLKEIDVQRNSLVGVENPDDAYATVVFGDSTVANNIPLLLESKLLANSVNGVSFVWSAVKGSEFILNGQSSTDSSSDKNGPALGESGLNRAYKDALDLPGVKKVIVKLGINDIVHPNCSNLSSNFGHTTTAAEIIAAYKEFVDLAHARGIEVYFMELTPWNGYTRNGTVSYTGTIDAVRLEVNAWLAKYGTAYDDIVIDKYTADEYSSTVTLGNNYGSSSFSQSCDNMYRNSPTNTYTGKSYNHSNAFDSFGFISLSALNQNNYTLKPVFTTDGIHFTASGQSQVAKQTPLSIFYTSVKEVSQAGQEVVVPDIYVASVANELMDNRYYYICNTEGNTANNTISGSQETNGVLTTSPTTASGSSPATYDMDMRYPTTWDSKFGAKLDLTDTSVKVQRGTSTAPYIVGAGVSDNTKWQILDVNGTNYWQNEGTGYFLAWYYPNTISGVYTIYRYTTGVVADDPRNSSGIFQSNKGWYTFTYVSPAGGYSTTLYYDGVLANKVFTYYDRWVQYLSGLSTKTVSQGYNCWSAVNSDNVSSDKRPPVTLYVDTNGEVKATMDLQAPAAWGSEVAKDTYKVDNLSGSYNLYYILSDNMPNATGGRENHVNNGSNLGNRADGNGQFNGYTYGYGQKLFFKSSDNNVATIQNSGLVNVLSTGVTTFTANYFWQEYDQISYVWDDNSGSYYTEAQKDAAIADGSKPNSTTEDGYHWVEVYNGRWIWTNYHWLTSSVQLINVEDYSTDIIIDNQTVDNYTKTDVFSGVSSSLEAMKITTPSDLEFLSGGHWVWTSSNSAVASISQQDGTEYATLAYTGASGSTTVTVTYVDSSNNPISYNGHVITSSVVVNTVAKELSIDVKVNNVITDYYFNNAVSENQAVALSAFVETPYTETTYSGSYSWKVYDMETGEESSSVITLSSATGKDVTATVVGEGTALALVTYTYVADGQTKTAVSFVLFSVGFGVTSDTVVYDFADSISYNLKSLSKDDTIAFKGISASLAGKVEITKSYSTPDWTDTSVTTARYTADLDKTDGVLYFRPVAITDGNADTVYFEALITSTGTDYKYSHVSFIPATTVYYEDSIGGINYTSGKVSGADAVSGQTGFWDVDYGSLGKDTGDLANQVYGYDPFYENCYEYSMGATHVVTVSKENNPNANFTTSGVAGAWPTAQFSFTGTGFDVVSLASNECGVVKVTVTGDNGYTKSFVVDSYMGYSCTEDSQNPWIKYTWEFRNYENAPVWYAKANEDGTFGVKCATNVPDQGESTTIPANPQDGDSFVSFVKNYTWNVTTDGNARFQIPVIKLVGLDYANYTVTITPTYSSAFDKAGAGSYKFYLDGVRVYGAADMGLDVYKEAKEAYPQYIDLKGALVNTPEAIESEIEGAVIIDGISGALVKDYLAYGANNEVVLNPGYVLACELTTSAKPTSVQLGVKSFTGDGNKVTVDVNGKVISTMSATDMFYNITDVIDSDGVIVITNNGSEPVSLTNLKVTFAANNCTASLTVEPDIALVAAPMMMRAMFAFVRVEEPEVPEVVPFEPSVSVDVADKATVGDKVTVKVSTSDDVAYITVNGVKVEEHDADFVWTCTLDAEAEGVMTVEVVAYSAEDEAAPAPVSASVTVEAKEVPVDPDPEPEETGIQKVVTAIKNFFNKLFGKK